MCPSATLARLQGAIAIAAVLSRFPRVYIADPDRPVRYKGSVFLRGLASLPTAVD